MHQTEELVNVIETVFQQLQLLDLALDSCYIDVFEEEAEREADAALRELGCSVVIR